MCNCTVCKNTDSYANKGFDSWPRGNPAGRKAHAEYIAHVRFCLNDGKNREFPNGVKFGDGSDFYSGSVSSKALVRATLRRSFGLEP